MPSPKTPGSSNIHKFQSRDVDIGLRRCASGSALPIAPTNPFRAGGEFRGFHGSLICYGLPGCSAPCTDLTGFPAIGAFYFQASNEIGPLLDMTTASTGLLCWRDFHPQEWQLDSLHGTLSPFAGLYAFWGSSAASTTSFDR